LYCKFTILGGLRSYLAGLSYSFSEAELVSPYCVGTLIASSWLLTSASCSLSDQQKIDVSKVNVLLGEETFGQQSSTYKVVGVSEIFYPNTFNPQGQDGSNDVALWKLNELVDVNTYTPLCLPVKDSTPTGKAKLVGWRLSSVTGYLNEEVGELDINLESTCDNGFLCGPADMKCQGDHGGPLIQASIVGIVSRDRFCSTSTAKFIQVSSNVDWIKSTVADNGGGTICTA